MGDFRYMGKSLSGVQRGLGSLTDANISNPQDGDTLVYNGTTGKWENSNTAVTSDVIASSLSLFKMGKLRVLQLNGCTSAAGGAITTLSNSDAPTTGITIPIVAYVSSRFFDGYLQISTSGAVVAKYFTENTASQWAVPAGGLVYGNATWFTS